MQTDKNRKADREMEKNKHKKAIQADSISVDQTYYTAEGYLVDHPIVTTCGIFEYQNEDGSIRRELRLPEDVFDEKSLESYKGKPIIITHDAGEVDKENVHKEQIGTIMGKGFRDGENVRCEIIIHDTNALKRCGLKELSLGYSVDKEETPGVYQGKQYDCIQKNIEINHLALVSEARAGETARLNIDRKDVGINNPEGGRNRMEKENPKGYQETQGSEVADLSPEELEAAVALFKAQQAANQATGSGTDGAEEGAESSEEAGRSPANQVREHRKQRDSDRSRMAPEEVIAEQESDIDLLLAEIDRLQAAHDMNGDEEPGQEEEKEQTEKRGGTAPEAEGGKEKEEKVNMDAVDKIIQERLDVCRMADKLHLDGMEGLPVMEGRKRIIRAVNSKINLDGKSDAYITAAYDIAKQSYQEKKSTDGQFQSMAAGSFRKDSREESRSSAARKSMITRMIGGKE